MAYEWTDDDRAKALGDIIQMLEKLDKHLDQYCAATPGAEETDFGALDTHEALKAARAEHKRLCAEVAA